MSFLGCHSLGLRMEMPGPMFLTPEDLQDNECNCVRYEIIKKTQPWGGGGGGGAHL